MGVAHNGKCAYNYNTSNIWQIESGVIQVDIGIIPTNDNSNKCVFYYHAGMNNIERIFRKIVIIEKVRPKLNKYVCDSFLYYINLHQ